jgi:hypothetical protein
MAESPFRLKDLRIVVSDGSEHRTFAKVDLLDSGHGLMIYDYQSRMKLSVHQDGQDFARVAGSGQSTIPTTSVPFSDIQHRVVYRAPIPPDSLSQLPPYTGPIDNCLVFSSTVFPSNGTFAAEIVDNSRLSAVLDTWHHHPDYVSAQTWRPTGAGKAVILTILNQRSTGSW